MDVNTLYKDLMFSVLRLVTTNADETGNTGTALFVDLELTHDGITPVLITNKHVVESATEISIHLPLGEGSDRVTLGDTVEIKMELEGDRFFSTPGSDVDLAVIPFGSVLLALENQPPSCQPFLRPLPVSEFPSSNEFDSLDALEEIFFIGFPDGRWDSVNKTPIIRRGSTATPATLHFDGRPEFLIDASVFSGSSGSPLFITRTTTVETGSRLMVQQLAMFAGIVTQSLHRTNRVSVFESDIDIDEPLNLGVVTNLAAVKDTLNQYCEWAKVPKPIFRTSPLN